MADNIIIVESPGKIKKIESILGADYKVYASFGHVRDLPDHDLGFSPPDFKAQYVATERGKETLAKLSRVIKNAKHVYLATDPDREGEAIAWHLKDALAIEKPIRITFGEITESAIKRAIQQPRSLDMHLVAAQQMRRLLDRAVGFTVSPLLQKKTGERLSAGRVQSPALRLLVEREQAIRKFKPTDHFGVMLWFHHPDKPTDKWFLEWDTQAWLKKYLPQSNYVMDSELASSVSNIRVVNITEYEKKIQNRAPPPPFTTSTLQQAASVALKIKPQKTMELAQKLYEGGHISYMRTDSPNLSEEAIAEIMAYGHQNGLSMSSKPRVWNAKENAQEAHEAIRPTHVEIAKVGDDLEQQLYEMIRVRAIACQMANAEYAVVQVKAEQQLNQQTIQFFGKSRQLTHPGWLGLMANDQTEEISDTWPENAIPKLQQGEEKKAYQGVVAKKRTKAPDRYTEASLTKELEAKGIGRPSTYVQILKTLHDRGYVSEEKRQLHATDVGERLISFLIGNFEFLGYEYTRDMEETLDKLAKKQAKYTTNMSEFWQLLQAELRRFEDSKEIKPKHPCPACGSAMRLVDLKDSKFWGCTDHPQCKTTLPDVDGAPGEKVKREVSQHSCTACGSGLIRRESKKASKKTDQFFWGCSGYPVCKKTYADTKGKPVLTDK